MGLLRLAGLAVATALVAGCGDSFSPEGVAGFYELKTVNGQELPYSETSGTTTTTVNNGSVTLNKNETFSYSINFTITQGTTSVTETDSEAGTFTLVEPNTIRLIEDDGDVTAATIDGDRITFIEDGDTFIFEK